MPRKRDPRTTTSYRNFAARIKAERKFCERCEKKGILVYKNLHVHHIKELSKGGSLKDRDNVELLCKRCHYIHHYGKEPPKKKIGIHELATSKTSVETGFNHFPETEER